MEDANKYWKKNKDKVCKFCRNGKDDMNHYMKECIGLKG